MSAADNAKALFTVLANYDFRMPLRDRMEGQEWAVKNPNTRDMYMGSKPLHERWNRKESDPHLT